MTTPTDPTTLRTALEALVGLVDCYGLDHYGGDWGCAECHPDSDMLVAGFQCGLHLARAALATPAPAADEARCWTALDVDGYACAEPADHPIHRLDKGYPNHPFQPAPTPAPPTPPATGPVSVGTMTDDEGRAFIAAAKGPATEPVAALVEALAHDLTSWVPVELKGAIRARLDAIVAAARAEGLDGAWAEVERALPEGWWLHSIYQRYFGDEVGYTATAHGGAGLGLQGNGPTPVEALRSLATNLRGHPDDGDRLRSNVRSVRVAVPRSRA